MTKQHPASDPSILEANGVRLNLGTGAVFCDGVPVDVMPAELAILEILMRSAGQVVSKGELAEALESKQMNPFESLGEHVNRLKGKLERGRRLIRVIEGAGYLFVTADEHGAGNYQLA